MATLESAYKKVKELVSDFKANEPYYLSPRYSEVEVRADYINEFFAALGWDVMHRIQKNPYEQEVKVEKGVKVGKAQKRADYAFHLAPNFRDPVFFVEAKKPARMLSNPDDYFQAIRYGWNTNNPIVILTDFEEFHIIDSRFKPDINTALNKKLQYFHYSEYADKEKLAEIYYLISREAVVNNSIEKYANSLPKPKGKAVQRQLFPGGFQSIDESFLDEIDEIRINLARAFKKSNPNLQGYELTEAIQRTIDRLVFIRFLEDKLIEQEHYISEFGESSDAWDDFVALSKRLDAKYNGVVFKHHCIDDPGFNKPKDIFSNICEDLSHLNSPYDFDKIPIHILGSIYERFLGKIVHTTPKRVTIEEKPEVKKAGGVYYTPRYIVRYIVANTVGNLIEGKTPLQISRMRFADIACGSGSFLIAVFEALLDYHNKWYQSNPVKAKSDGCFHQDGKWILSLKQKKNILLNNIYGVDIDSQAVEVTQLSLCLKLMEDETTATANEMMVLFHEQILPDLTKNIVCGNSLIGWDIEDGQLFPYEEMRKLNPMDFKNAFEDIMKDGGFDAIVGNPPYVDSEEMTKSHLSTRKYCVGRYSTAKGNWDMYCVFSERAIRLLNDKGLFGFIIPNKFISAPYGSHLKKLFSQYTVQYLVDYSSVPVFKISVYPVVIVVSKQDKTNKGIYIKVKEEKGTRKEIYKKKFRIKSNDTQWAQKFDVHEKLLIKIFKKSGNLSNHFNIESAATVSEAYEIKKIITENSKPKKSEFTFINTGTIDRYLVLWGYKRTKYIKAFYEYPVVDSIQLSKLFPNRYIQAKSEKLILAGMVKRLEAAYDKGDILAGKSTTIILNKTNKYDLKFLLGLINSTLFSTIFYIRNKHNAMAGGYLNVNKKQFNDMPFIELNLSIDKEKAIYDKVIVLVNQLLSATKELASAKTDKDINYYERKCNNIDSEINNEVYKLYGLSKDEIEIINSE